MNNSINFTTEADILAFSFGVKTIETVDVEIGAAFGVFFGSCFVVFGAMKLIEWRMRKALNNNDFDEVNDEEEIVTINVTHVTIPDPEPVFIIHPINAEIIHMMTLIKPIMKVSETNNGG